MRGLVSAILNSILSVALLWWIFPSVSIIDWSTLIGAGLVLGVLQLFIRPILKLLFLPINIITLGVFSWVINVFILWLATQLVPGFSIEPMIFLGYQLGQLGTFILITFMLSLAQSFVGIFIGWVMARQRFSFSLFFLLLALTIIATIILSVRVVFPLAI